MGEGATGAIKVGAGTEDGDVEEDILREREEGGEEVGRWGLVAAAPPGTGGVPPWVAATAGGRQGAAALTLENGFALATMEADVSGGSGVALAAASVGAGH